MEDEEWIKSNTDCVYFLASPLTCKKGIECEYRHNDIARLNPRDCWYWLAGNCPNPNCAFRHPPLDVPTDGSLECTNSNNPSAATSLRKTNVACYFFFNGFCNKGERCTFLHGSSDNSDKESSKTVSAFFDRPVTQKTLAVISVNGSGAPVITHAKPSKISIYKRTAFELKSQVENLQNHPENITLPTVAKHSSDPLYEEDTACKLNSPLPTKELLQGTSHELTDQSSDDQVENHTEEDCLESSPGFDVIVDNMSDDFGYEDDPKGFLCEDGEGNGRGMHHIGYHFKDFDIMHPDENLLFEHDVYRSSDHSDIGNQFVRAKEIPYHAREREMELHLPQKRNFFHARQASGCMDLRNLLKRRRSNYDDDHDFISSELKSYQTEERYRQPVSKRLQGRLRLASKVESNSIGSQIGNVKEHGHSTVIRPWKHLNGRRQSKQQNSKKISRKRQSSEETIIFTSPKSLAHIREEKRREKESMSSCERQEPSSGTIVKEFESPKSLTEILKEKRMVRSAVNDIVDIDLR